MWFLAQFFNYRKRLLKVQRKQGSYLEYSIEAVREITP